MTTSGVSCIENEVIDRSHRLERPATDRTYMKLMVITPQMAMSLLEAADGISANFRKRTKKNYDKMIRDMKNRRWWVNGETIKFNLNGIVIDGQHRLYACVCSGQPFTTWACFNVDDEAGIGIDKGMKRTLAQELAHRGFSNIHATAATLRLLTLYHYSSLDTEYSNTDLTDDDCLGLLDVYPSIHDATKMAASCREFAFVSELGVIGSLVLPGRLAPSFDNFVTALKTGENLHKTSPALHLRNLRIKDLTSNMSLDRIVRRALTVKAWNHWAADRAIGVLKMSANEKFPEIIIE